MIPVGDDETKWGFGRARPEQHVAYDASGFAPLMVLPVPQAAAAAEANGVSVTGGILIAVATAIATSLLSLLVQWLLMSRKERTEARRAKIDRITRQLSELYGPLYLLKKQSTELAQKLRHDKETPDWHLLGHLREVMETPTDKAIAQQILVINEEIQTVLSTHAGLIKDGEIPKSFVDVLGHYRLLGIAWEAAERGEYLASGESPFEVFPTAFDEDVERSYNALVRELMDERRALEK